MWNIEDVNVNVIVNVDKNVDVKNWRRERERRREKLKTDVNVGANIDVKNWRREESINNNVPLLPPRFWGDSVLKDVDVKVGVKFRVLWATKIGSNDREDVNVELKNWRQEHRHKELKAGM